MSANDNSWVVVTGAGGALGNAIASHFASGGRRVLGLDRNFDDASTLSGAAVRKVDLLDENEVQQALADAISANEAIALLVNAVGLIWNEPILSLRGAKFVKHELESWRRVIDANLTAPFVAATQVAARMVRRGGGSIVNISSIASGANPGQAAYGAAKSGIEGLTRTMAAELGPLGVRVNALALGFVDVATTRAAVPSEQLNKYAQSTPLGRLGRVEDVIDAVEFLATNAFINGEIVKLDGGLRL